MTPPPSEPPASRVGPRPVSRREAFHHRNLHRLFFPFRCFFFSASRTAHVSKSETKPSTLLFFFFLLGWVPPRLRPLSHQTDTLSLLPVHLPVHSSHPSSLAQCLTHRRRSGVRRACSRMTSTNSAWEEEEAAAAAAARVLRPGRGEKLWVKGYWRWR